jgi:hypothetical protein
LRHHGSVKPGAVFRERRERIEIVIGPQPPLTILGIGNRTIRRRGLGPDLGLDHTGDEKTAVRFTIGEDGKVTDINTRPKSLIRETRKVRSNIIPATGAAVQRQ